jgi:hypothetical protein
MVCVGRWVTQIVVDSRVIRMASSCTLARIIHEMNATLPAANAATTTSDPSQHDPKVRTVRYRPPGPNGVSRKALSENRKGPLTWEPPIGIEPMTYSLRVLVRAVRQRPLRYVRPAQPQRVPSAMLGMPSRRSAPMAWLRMTARTEGKDPFRTRHRPSPSVTSLT